MLSSKTYLYLTKSTRLKHTEQGLHAILPSNTQYHVLYSAHMEEEEEDIS